MRVLHVLDHGLPLHSGYAFRTRAIVREQQRVGIEPLLLTGPKQNSGAQLSESAEGLEFLRTPPERAVWAGWGPLAQWGVVTALEARLNQLIPQLQPNVLHAHSPALCGLAALRAGRRFGLPVVYEVRALWEDAAVSHGTSAFGSWRYRITRALESYVLRRADAVTCICEGLREEIVARGVPDAQVTVIPNGVNIDDFPRLPAEKPAELARQWGVQGKVVAAFIGSFYAYEGLPLLIEAMARLPAGVDDLVLLLAGGGPEAQRVEALIKAHNLQERVVWRGRVPHDQVSGLYQLSDFLVYPRLPERITEMVTPLKPLEAMAMGRPVLASDVGGHRELIAAERTGMLFPAGDADALAEALLAMRNQVREPSRAQQLSMILDTARAYVENQRNWAASIAPLPVLYDSLTQRAQAARD
ncbi:TIGR04063 family PEP-CTERM/XrtA system glycosyltransferase [Magnetofaba australis]|uniref:Putative membrane-anchored group 1 glycosyltransferase n=1 Tax=Magnetofaba australis IT-1 TaxID=1434232 RepID=A0A1Y2K857_9PROT|nr:TIGR04063 family PEP-CTERM/XrtA system glycosyltransferase [Magnetofaba australis]OSM06862.1 putative membrane-anchored group 1 glycosyltransferase [Magnetofaba australis IT-1]